jgi:hypothetical protein
MSKWFTLLCLFSLTAQASTFDCAKKFKDFQKLVAESVVVGEIADVVLPQWNRFRDKSFTVYLVGKTYTDVAFVYLLPYQQVLPISPGASWQAKIGAGSVVFGRGVYNEGLRFISPIPLPKNQHPVNQVFETLWNNPAYTPSLADVELLKKYNAVDSFAERQQFYKEHPNWRTAQRVAALGFGGAIVASTSLAFAQGAMMANNTFTASQFLERPSANDQAIPIVQILIETTPFPHTSLRIGDTVYSYGFTHLTAQPVSAYLGDLIKNNQADANQIGDLPVAVGDADDSSSAYLGLARLQNNISKNTKRSVRVVEINFSLEEVVDLRRDIERNVGKRYVNKTLINDCSSMIMRALDRNTDIHVPSWVDPYPSVSAAVLSTYLLLRANLGDNRIGKTMMIVPDGTNSNLSYVVRNTLIGMLEGRVFINTAMFPVGPAQRGYMDLIESDEDREYYDPEVAAVLKKWRIEAANKLRSELINYYGDADIFVKIGKLPKSDPASKTKRDQARSVINQQIDDMQLEINEVLNSPYVTLRDLEESAVKLTVLEQTRNLWLKQIGD